MSECLAPGDAEKIYLAQFEATDRLALVLLTAASIAYIVQVNESPQWTPHSVDRKG